MKCYLAHPVTDYGGTERQRQAISLIEARGWTVENPDAPIHQEAYRQHGMSHFLDVVDGCDALVFLRFPSGDIGAGVAKEIERALRRRMDVLDASNGELNLIGNMMPVPILTVEQTRCHVADIKSLTARRSLGFIDLGGGYGDGYD